MDALAQQSLGTIRPGTTYDLYLGKRFSGVGEGEFFYGLLDELSLYNRALTASEILDIYNAGVGGKCRSNEPAILIQPSSRTTLAGGTALFRVNAAGLALTYQWHFNTSEIPGATGSSLTLTNVGLAQEGSYWVTVTNNLGLVESDHVSLTIDFSCFSAPAGLVSWWPAEGTTVDTFGGNDGVAHGNLGFSAGESGQAFAFDGTNAYLSLGKSPSLNVGQANGFTIECWINPSNASTYNMLVEWNDGVGNVGVQLQFSVAALGGIGSLLTNIKDSNGVDHLFASSPNLITNGGFQHVALTYDKATGVGKLYRNGVVVKSQTIGSITPQTSYPLYFGARISGPGTGGFFKGLMDEPALYNRALTDAEIQTIYNSGTAGKTCIPLEIVTHPQSLTTRLGSNATFSVGVRGSFPLNYQWRFNGNDIIGATNGSLTLTNVQPSDAGNYSVRVTNNVDSITSSNGLLKVTVVLAYANSQPLTNSQYSFGGPVTIQLTNLFPNGLIFYTLDGSIPTASSALYNGPFAITQSSILRALGYRTDFLQSGQMDPITILIVPTYTLSVTNGGGGGSVSLNPPGGSYISNTLVTLTATPSAGWSFLQWLGDASGTNPVTSVAVTRNKRAQALFGTTVGTTTAGGGSILLSPPGGTYPFGTPVWCSALPISGSYFAFWGNAASGDTNPFRLIVTNPNPTVSALFASVNAGQVALTVIPVGNGQINVSPRANIYTSGQNVSVTAIPDAGQSFLGWSGDASGSQNPLQLTLNQSRAVYALFSHGPLLIVTGNLNGLKPEGLRFTVSGDFGVQYEIQSASNLPAWSVLGRVTNTYGVIQFLDTTVSTTERRFYRARLLP